MPTLEEGLEALLVVTLFYIINEFTHDPLTLNRR
jgi:hypothetical protein